MSSSPKQQNVQTIQTPESSTDSSNALTFVYRSQKVKVVCTDSYKTTVDALIQACPKLLKAPRALIGLETSNSSGSRCKITESNWSSIYKSKSRNSDAVIEVIILPIPRPAQDNNTPYLDIPTHVSYHSDSELTSHSRATARATESKESVAPLPLSDRSNSCCPTCGSSGGSIKSNTGSVKSENNSGAENSKSNQREPQSRPRPVSTASAPEASSSNTTARPVRRTITPEEHMERHRQRLAHERQLLSQATGYHAEKRRSQLAMHAQLEKTQDRYMAIIEKQKAKELKAKQKQQSGSRSSGVSSWIGKIF